MLKNKFSKESPTTVFNWLIKENPLLKDKDSAVKITETLFEDSFFKREVIRDDDTKVYLFLVHDDSNIDEFILFEIYITEDGNDYNYENYYNIEDLKNRIKDFE